MQPGSNIEPRDQCLLENLYPGLADKATTIRHTNYQGAGAAGNSLFYIDFRNTEISLAAGQTKLPESIIRTPVINSLRNFGSQLF